MDKTWKTVRVFVASAFRDMHVEREHLQTIVFPALRQRFAQDRIDVLDIDLCRGVPEGQAEASEFLPASLHEMDRCDVILGLLGHRYGHVHEQVPDGLAREHPWLAEYPGRSTLDW